MMAIYRLFGGENDRYDYSEEAAMAYFQFESTGKNYIGLELQPNGKYNGYAVGKHSMDITLSMWLHDIMDGLLFIWELYEDPQFKDCHWWLDKVVKEPIKRRLEAGEKMNLWFVDRPNIRL